MLCGYAEGNRQKDRRDRKSSTRKRAVCFATTEQKLDELAGILYEKETITGDEFMSVLNGKVGE